MDYDELGQLGPGLWGVDTAGSTVLVSGCWPDPIREIVLDAASLSEVGSFSCRCISLVSEDTCVSREGDQYWLLDLPSGEKRAPVDLSGVVDERGTPPRTIHWALAARGVPYFYARWSSGEGAALIGVDGASGVAIDTDLRAPGVQGVSVGNVATVEAVGVDGGIVYLHAYQGRELLLAAVNLDNPEESRTLGLAPFLSTSTVTFWVSVASNGRVVVAGEWGLGGFKLLSVDPESGDVFVLGASRVSKLWDVSPGPGDWVLTAMEDGRDDGLPSDWTCPFSDDSCHHLRYLNTVTGEAWPDPPFDGPNYSLARLPDGHE